MFLVILFAYLVADLAYAIGAQIFAFLLLLFIDDRLHYVGLITGDYLRVRLVATGIACISLLVIVLT